RCLDNLNHPRESRVPHDVPKRSGPHRALADPFMAVKPRPGRPLGIVEMQALEEGEPDLPIELLPYRFDSGDHIVPRSVQMSRVQAKRHTLAEPEGNRVAERPQLPESAPERGSRTRCALDQQPHVTGDGGQALGVSAGVAS